MNVGAICGQLAVGGAYGGVAELCLAVAEARDEQQRAQHFYRSGQQQQPQHDVQGYTAFQQRMECYRTIIDHLNQLVGAAPPPPPSIPDRPGPPSPPPAPTLPSDEATSYAKEMTDLVVASKDELAHVTLYQWLLETRQTDALLAIHSPYLETYLTSQGSMRELLWRFYERQKQYVKAAKTLLSLAEETGGGRGVAERVELVSRALMCVSAGEMSTAASHADFLLHLEEKKEVARVQLLVLHGLQVLDYIF